MDGLHTGMRYIQHPMHRNVSFIANKRNLGNTLRLTFDRDPRGYRCTHTTNLRCP